MNIRDYSPITWAFVQFFQALRLLPPQCVMHWVTGSRSKLDPLHVASEEQTVKRSREVEYFLIAYFVLDVVAFAATFAPESVWAKVALGWAVLRAIDIVQATVNVALFDYIRGRPDNKVASKTRLALLGMLNYLELMICFSIVYACCTESLVVQEHIPKDALSWNALYFSVLTQLTISFGDVTPKGAFRAVAGLQALVGWAFIVLIFARTISALPRIEEVVSPKRDVDA